MRLLADVHVKSAYLAALRGDGHDVRRVVDVLDEASSNVTIVEHAREPGRAVVTNDAKDFAQFTDHPGVLVVLRLGSLAAKLPRASCGSNGACQIRVD
jgi:predicted nuclease of predicted toxin-antitoxin system